MCDLLLAGLSEQGGWDAKHPAWVVDTFLLLIMGALCGHAISALLAGLVALLANELCTDEDAATFHRAAGRTWAVRCYQGFVFGLSCLLAAITFWCGLPILMLLMPGPAAAAADPAVPADRLMPGLTGCW